MVSVFGAHTLLLDNNCKVYAIGCNKDGKSCGWLGIEGEESVYDTPQRLSTKASIQMVSTGAYHSVFLDCEGKVWSCGMNTHGQCANQDVTLISKVPEICFSKIPVRAISAGGNHSLFIDDEGSVWGLGSNEHGQLGSTPLQKCVNTPRKAEIEDVKHLALGFDFSMVIDNHDRLYGFGDNSYSQIYEANVSPVSTPFCLEEFKTVIGVECGYRHCLVLTPEGLWSWGQNAKAQVKKPLCRAVRTPHKVSVGKDIISFSAGHSHSGCVDKSGDVWLWGSNEFGQVGTNKLGNFAPQQLQGLGKAKKVFCSSHTIIALENGELWGFGKNNLGQLGLGTRSHAFNPAKIQLPSTFEIYAQPNVGAKRPVEFERCQNEAKRVANDDN